MPPQRIRRANVVVAQLNGLFDDPEFADADRVAPFNNHVRDKMAETPYFGARKRTMIAPSLGGDAVTAPVKCLRKDGRWITLRSFLD